MPLTASFSIGQLPSNPSILVATDTSTGSDVLVVARRIYIQDANGNYLVPTGTTTQYTVWPIADLIIQLNVLSNDAACSVMVEWVDSGGTARYTVSNTFCFSLFSKQFAYSLIQGLVPLITLNTNYSANLANLWAAIKGAINAVEDMSDIFTSQNCLNQAINFKKNQSLYF